LEQHIYLDAPISGLLQKVVRMKTHKTTVGVFHRDESNRKALIKLLSKDYDCIEISRWEDVGNSKVEVLVLASPELLYPEISFEQMKQEIYGHEASIVMINNDQRKWWIYRMRFKQLRNPSMPQLLESIKGLCPKRKVNQLFNLDRLRTQLTIG
jgi:hypothetical protein